MVITRPYLHEALIPCFRRNGEKRIKPFLRWVGGKSKFTTSILDILPSKEIVKTYYEPFLGAGSVYFAYLPDDAILSDLNDQLINTYQAVVEKPEIVSKYLKELGKLNSKDFYYHIRLQYNKQKQRYKQASRFIYLNHTSFNGIFRVNKKGEYNVPYGYKINPNFPTDLELVDISKRMHRANIFTSNYVDAVSSAKSHDVVYLDPPYPPINGTSFFTHYTKERFSHNDQVELARTAFKLTKKRCYVIITIADTPEIRDLYKGWYLYNILRPRWVTSSKVKHRVNELIITNFRVHSG